MMNRIPATGFARALFRATRCIAVAAIVASPLMAVPGVKASEDVTIEAPTMKRNSGAGLVLMVSLRRG